MTTELFRLPQIVYLATYNLLLTTYYLESSDFATADAIMPPAR